ATTIRSCCECCVPIQPTSTRLAPSDPTMAPTVFAAYTPPTSRAGSCPRAATAASASGKLAPHRMADGSTAKSARTLSTCRLIQGLETADGLMGQNGSDWLSTYAVHAIEAQSSNWHQPSAVRGRARRDAMADPTLLPMPRPKRNTARMSENVYVVAPKSNESSRVQMTSAASAVNPDSAMTTYTPTAPVARAGLVSSSIESTPLYGATLAISRPPSATATLMATATYVAIAVSCT